MARSAAFRRPLVHGVLALAAFMATPAAAATKYIEMVGENFEATVEIRADGTYTESFDGVLTAVDYAAQMVKIPASKDTLDRQMDQLAAMNSSKKNHRIVTYIGDARFKTHEDFSGHLPKPGEKTHSAPWRTNGFMIGASDKVTYTLEVFSKPLQEKVNKAEVHGVGNLCVKTPLPVVDSDADEKPVSPDGCYVWHLKTGADGQMDKPVTITVQRPQEATGAKTAAKPTR